ncbi:hypothetical protein GCM10007939_25140 [Amylibacter marinus]|uniref:Uncharacterized protein n=1 Tax=Amylibacter marinus TaxID=1475483 RepID=A0ABQ5VXT4_9RHOB|nr:hypothetical protein GCM10007939_25140 [Amylibacter marinus]
MRNAGLSLGQLTQQRAPRWVAKGAKYRIKICGLGAGGIIHNHMVMLRRDTLQPQTLRRVICLTRQNTASIY